MTHEHAENQSCERSLIYSGNIATFLMDEITAELAELEAELLEKTAAKNLLEEKLRELHMRLLEKRYEHAQLMLSIEEDAAEEAEIYLELLASKEGDDDDEEEEDDQDGAAAGAA